MAVPLRQITALCWITGPEDPSEALCFGNVEGSVTIWRHNGRLVSYRALNIAYSYLLLRVGSKRWHHAEWEAGMKLPLLLMIGRNKVPTV